MAQTAHHRHLQRYVCRQKTLSSLFSFCCLSQSLSPIIFRQTDQERSCALTCKHLSLTAPRRPPPTSTKTTSPLSTFLSARVSFLLPPSSSLIQYDQAGLILSLTNNTNPSSTSTTTSSSSPPKWIKTGVEIYNNLPRAATVACDAWADWSLATVIPSSSSSSSSSSGGGNEWVTVEITSEVDELGKSLWVYQIVNGENKIPLREICWPFGLEPGEEWEVTVEAYACRPNKEAEEELSAQFRDFEVMWK